MFKRLTYNKEPSVSYKWFHQEINKLEVVFQNNDFPKSFVDLYIKKYLDKKFNEFDVVRFDVLPFIGKNHSNWELV